MERLTYFDHGKYRLKMGDTEHSGLFVDRLAAYEDIGLAPEEILTGKELAEIAIGLQQLNRIHCVFSYERMEEVMQAEKEGRLTIHPPAKKCPQCHRNQLVARTDGKFYYCSGCKTQSAESDLQGGGL